MQLHLGHIRRGQHRHLMATTLDASYLRALQGIVSHDIPGFEVRFKDRSTLMKVLGFLAYPFNPDFMTKYITTWGTKVYFPTEEFFRSDPARSFRILAHEYVHLWDAKNHPLFKLSYMFPQVLVLIPLVLYVLFTWPHTWIVVLPFLGYLLGCLSARLHRLLFWAVMPITLAGAVITAWALTGYAVLALFGVLVALVPWPAPWRTKWELRGYGMNVALAQRLYGSVSQKHKDSITKQFTGPAYYFMCWSSAKVQESLEVTRAKFVAGILQKERPYEQVFGLFNKG